MMLSSVVPVSTLLEVPTMADVCKCEAWLCVDSAGDYAVGNSEAAAREKYEEDVQALSDCGGFRMVQLWINVPLPAIVELTGDAPNVGTAALAAVA